LNSTEIILAIMLLLSFTFFIVKMEKILGENLEEIAEKFVDKTNQTECSTLINFYYGHAGGNLNEKIKCDVNNANMIPSNVKVLEQGKIFVGVQKHYA